MLIRFVSPSSPAPHSFTSASASLLLWSKGELLVGGEDHCFGTMAPE